MNLNAEGDAPATGWQLFDLVSGEEATRDPQ